LRIEGRDFAFESFGHHNLLCHDIPFPAQIRVDCKNAQTGYGVSRIG
jgi:hypothetical protein